MNIADLVKPPKSLGFDADRLKLIDGLVMRGMEDKLYPAAAYVVMRHGMVAAHGAFGMAQPDAKPADSGINQVILYSIWLPSCKVDDRNAAYAGDRARPNSAFSNRCGSCSFPRLKTRQWRTPRCGSLQPIPADCRHGKPLYKSKKPRAG